jgi:hypothetical protein
VNFVFGEWAELAAQVHQRTLDVLAVGAGARFNLLLHGAKWIAVE